MKLARVMVKTKKLVLDTKIDFSNNSGTNVGEKSIKRVELLQSGMRGDLAQLKQLAGSSSSSSSCSACVCVLARARAR